METTFAKLAKIKWFALDSSLSSSLHLKTDMCMTTSDHANQDNILGNGAAARYKEGTGP